MSDPYAETDIWPVPARNWTLTASEPENAPTPTREPDRASAGLVERLAEAIWAAQPEQWRDNTVPEDCVDLARAVLPLVAAQVEAAVSVVRAEARGEFERLGGLVSRWAADHNRALARAEAAEAERDALREKVARVEALRDEWAARPIQTDEGYWDPIATAYNSAASALDRALSDPTTSGSTESPIAALQDEPKPMTLSHDRLILQRHERDGGQVVVVRCTHTIGLCFETEHDDMGKMLGILPCPCNDPSEVVAYVDLVARQGHKCEGEGACIHCGADEPPPWPNTALSDPTTPDQTGGDAPPSIADTCCGKCPGDTCYVDGVTGA